MIDNNNLIKLRQLLDEAIQTESRDNTSQFVEVLSEILNELNAIEVAPQDNLSRALRILKQVRSSGSLPTEQLPGNTEQQAEFLEYLNGIINVQKFALSLANGDLSQSLKAKGMVSGSLKSLQANLRHLTWQTRMIATGDLNQKVDFMGEFSDSFNSMVSSLKEARDQIKQREEQLAEANKLLRREISEVKRTEEKLKEAYKDLESFSYSVSHDLRAPLRHVSGFFELLKKRMEAGADEQNLHYASRIEASARRMSMMIDDLLEFSRTGSAALDLENINPNEIIDEIINDMEIESKGRKIKWSIDRLPAVYADKSMLRLVITNLISNAVKYTAPREIAEISIRSKESGHEFIFELSDNGVGFDMQNASRLFGVFQRLHGQNEFEGTGIGLANVRRIILRHGGRTWAEGSPGQGATFYFSLLKK